MKYLLSTLMALALHSAAASDEYSVVVGNGVKVDGVAELGDDWNTGYIWLVNAKQTVSGPSVKGRIRIVAVSHAQPTDAYIRSVQLFVLSPIVKTNPESNEEPKFSLIASSPLYKKGRYCVAFRPSQIAIPIDDAAVERDEDNDYCFSKKALLEAARQ